MKRVAFVIIPVLLIAFVIWQSTGNTDEYIISIEKYWEDKHRFFETSQASPFVQKDQAYVPIKYFSPNPEYKINATLTRFTTRETLALGNSDGSQTKYLKFAQANFKIKGQKYSLLILKALGFGGQYLTAFVDETSGRSTYGGGRYLDISIGKSDKIEIDFNKAYNPYCAYFDDFLCPLPPRENFLKVAIEAGEKNYID